MLLAAERKEVDLIGSIGIATMHGAQSRLADRAKAPMIYQAALTRHPLAPHVPALARTRHQRRRQGRADRDRRLRRDRPLDHHHAERAGGALAALRKAFNAMVADPAFLEQMKKRNVIIEPLTGQQLDKISLDTLQTPPNVLKLVKDLVEVKK